MLNIQFSKACSKATLMATNNPLEQISDNLKDLNESFKSILSFFNKVGGFFEELSYWVSHPVETINALEPWVIILLMSLLVLKLLGFKTDKWLSLIFLLFILILIF